ncbi:MAG TPA: ABC transporter permease subunit [Beijerinckiaceae bacterium]
MSLTSLQARIGRAMVPALPFLWLAVFFLLPFIIVVKISLSDPATAQPPYRPVLDLGQGLAGLGDLVAKLDVENFTALLGDDLYVQAALSSVRIAAVSTALLLLLGYPVAYAMARAPARWRPLLIALVILPFWTSFLIRVYAWIGILRPEGVLNQALMLLGLASEPLTILNTETAVFIGIVYAYFPFMILPLYASLERLDDTLIEAAQDLGCPPWKAFWAITLPLSLPGAIAGSLLCFIPIVGEFVVPDLLGGSDTLMIGRVLWSEFFSNRDWPLASAVAIILLILLVVPIVYFQNAQAKLREADK